MPAFDHALLHFCSVSRKALGVPRAIAANPLKARVSGGSLAQQNGLYDDCICGAAHCHRASAREDSMDAGGQSALKAPAQYRLCRGKRAFILSLYFLTGRTLDPRAKNR
jgi:hypothetical protein